MAKMDWMVNQERVVLKEARAKTGVMARAAHRVPVVNLGTKELQANEAGVEWMGSLGRMAKMVPRVIEGWQVSPVLVGSPERKVTMVSV